ncbi:superoxide dismutase [Alkalibacillus haloalkaliphilus]|uniref:superoxide dismutase n=1 Tax=Alkalibacillus haloalkaliphilus TaxID=94136 RepID=UPI0029369313|nr:superoxide dismutase [Alkalibacillus haloalkaliphilus]MDV2580744.1 superoxide dismutase [Alkalibacillus haloalkaliphilus]
MKHDYLNQFIEDLSYWTAEFVEKWERIQDNFLRQDEVNQEGEELDQSLGDFLTQVETYYHHRGDLTADIAKELQTDAAQLYERWNQLIHKKDHKQDDGNSRSVPIGGHELPPLPYDYNALEPYIDERIMRLHHQKHHQSYVDGLNKAERKMQEARQSGDYELIKHWEREAAFNGAGHYLHTIFWNVMSPDGGGEPTGDLLNEINNSFGSYEQFKEHFSEAAKNVEAVGWAILVWSPRSHRLEILQAEKHQNLTQWDVIPLLPLDVWEHAYYLQYENKRGDYVDEWWNVVNWDEVEQRYQEARQVEWTPY